MLNNTFGLTLLLILAGSALSGCAFIHPEEYSRKTIAAVSHSEQKISEKVDALDSSLGKQAYSIESLESKIINLSNEVEALKKYQIRQASLKKAEAVKANPTVTSNVVVSDFEEPQARTGMVTLGSLERVYIDIVKSSFVARVDTGATTSSINAVDMQKFERNGKKWVKFHVSDVETAVADRKWVEAPIVRHVKIRQSSADDLERRPVVDLWVKLGSIHEKTQFTLTDRTQMDYPILLGREFIQDVAYVDVSRDFIASKKRKSAPSTDASISDSTSKQ